MSSSFSVTSSVNILTLRFIFVHQKRDKEYLDLSILPLVERGVVRLETKPLSPSYIITSYQNRTKFVHLS